VTSQRVVCPFRWAHEVRVELIRDTYALNLLLTISAFVSRE